MKIVLERTHKERLRSNDLVECTTLNQKSKGISSFRDTQTLAVYLFSPRGYAYRKSNAGMYQLNPRVFLNAAVKGKRRTKATVRTTDAGAQIELVIKGVKNFRRK